MTEATSQPVIIGGGAWGAAIAAALQRAGHDPMLLVRSQRTVEDLAKGQCRQLPDAPPVAPLAATLDTNVLADARLVFCVVPVGATRDMLKLVGETAPVDAIIILCAKGLADSREGEGLLMHELAADILPGHDCVLLSGPSFADEVFSGLPCAITAASMNEQACREIQDAFAGSNLRVYGNDDPAGVAVGGTMKNVIAIAAGCAVGLGLGDNARAAIITRGLAEMARFAAALGARPDTIYGLSGAGDLALTCAGPHSRNFAYGLALGRGETPQSALAEGRHTVAALAARGRAAGIDLPITTAVDEVVNQGYNLQDVVRGLLARRASSE